MNPDYFKTKKGIRCVTHKLKSSNTISMVLRFDRVGSVFDPKSLEGSHHLLEHLFFSKEMDKKLAKVGASGDGSIYCELVSFYFHFPKESFERVLEIISDGFNKLYNLSSLKTVGVEVDVIKREYLMSKRDPHFKIGHLCDKKSLSKKYSRSVSEIVSKNKFSLDALQKLAKKSFTFSNCVFICTGDVPSQQEVVKNCDNILKLSPLVNKSKYPVCKRKAISFSKSSSLEEDFLLFVFPLFYGKDDRRFFNKVISDLFINSAWSRFYKLLRENEGLVYDMGGHHLECDTNGYFEFSLAVSPKNSIKVKKIILDECNKIYKEGINKEEWLMLKKLWEVDTKYMSTSQGDLLDFYEEDAYIKNKKIRLQDRISPFNWSWPKVQKSIKYIFNPNERSVVHLKAGRSRVR